MAKIILNVDLNYEGASADLKKLKADLNGIGNPSGAKNIDSLRKSYANLINTIQGAEKNYAKGTFSKIAEEAKKYLDEVKKLDPATADYAKQSKHLDDELKRLQADFAEIRTGAKNFHGSLKDIVSGFMKFQLAAMLVMKPLQMIRDAFDSINETLEETEKRVISLQRVAGGAANATDLYNLAARYGQSFENVSDVVERFAKSGYDWEESLKAAEAALTAMNVAELDSEQASEGLIAIMKQYGYEIENLNYLIGVLNKTSDSAAVTTEELLIALQKTGSTAKNANITFEETVGLITALSEGTAASGQNMGNALRSLIVFTSDSKALDTFAGLSTNMAETVKNYRAGQASILDVWEGLGGELQGMGSQKGTLEDLFGGTEMSADIEAQLTQITDSFAEIYGTAGNYRQNYFIALLNNIKEVTDVTENLGDVTSYSQAENLKYLSTYEGKVASLEAKWQEMANDEQGILKFKKEMAELGGFGLDVLDLVGGVRTAAIALGGALLTILVPALKAANIKLKELGITANTSIGYITLIITVVSMAIGAFQKYREEIRESNKQTISLWESNQEYAANLNYLSQQLNKASTETEEYKNVEKELVEIFGEENEALKDKTRNTEEYKVALQELTDVELKRLKLKQQNALIAAQRNLEQRNDWFSIVESMLFSSEGLLQYITGLEKEYAVFSDAGIDFNSQIKFDSADEIADYYDYLIGIRDQLLERLDSGAITDERMADAYKDIIIELNSGISSLEPDVTAYRNALKTIEELTKAINGETEDTRKELDKIYKGTSTFSKKELEDVLSKVEEIRNATKNTLEYEEKKKAVLEAEKALLDAQNNRTVRVLNEATGQWEWVSNEKDVESARENVEKARLALEDGFFTDVKTLFESGNQTTEDIFKLMEKWFGEGGGTQATGKLLELLGINQNWGRWWNYEDVKNAGYGDWVLDENAYFAKTGTWKGYRDYLANAYTQIANQWGITPAYDSGGVLRGLGGIKATTNDEVVLDPSISKKLLSPVSNKQFDTFVNDLGLLFGVSKSVSSNGIIYTNGGCGVDSHDKHYNVNGVPIPVEAAGRYTISELFDVMNIIPNI